MAGSVSFCEMDFDSTFHRRESHQWPLSTAVCSVLLASVPYRSLV